MMNNDINYPSLYEKSFSNAPIGMALVSLEGRWIKVNRTLCEFTGYTEEQLAKMTFLDITYPEDVNKDVELIKDCLSGKISSYVIEKRYISKSGKILWARLSKSVAQDDNGKPLFFISHIENIELQKALEIKIEKERTHLSSIINSIVDPLFVKNVEHTWVLVNDAFCKFIGHNEQEILGKTDYDFMPKAQADVFWLKDKEVIDTGNQSINEEQLTDADQKTHTIVTKKNMYKNLENEVFIVGTIRDITDQKLKELELEKSNTELARMNALMVGREIKMAELKKQLSEIS